MSRFTITENGWPATYATPDEVAQALWRVHRGDELSNNGMVQVAPPETRREGYIAEMLMRDWLKEQTIPFVYNGGVDSLPDFVIAGVRTAVKCCGTTYDYRMRYLVYVFNRFLNRNQQQFAFWGIERKKQRFLLLGAITTEGFMAASWPFKEGDMVCRGFIASEPGRACVVKALDPPDRERFLTKEPVQYACPKCGKTLTRATLGHIDTCPKPWARATT